MTARKPSGQGVSQRLSRPSSAPCAPPFPSLSGSRSTGPSAGSAGRRPRRPDADVRFILLWVAFNSGCRQRDRRRRHQRTKVLQGFLRRLGDPRRIAPHLRCPCGSSSRRRSGCCSRTGICSRRSGTKQNGLEGHDADWEERLASSPTPNCDRHTRRSSTRAGSCSWCSIAFYVLRNRASSTGEPPGTARSTGRRSRTARRCLAGCCRCSSTSCWKIRIETGGSRSTPSSGRPSGPGFLLPARVGRPAGPRGLQCDGGNNRRV